MIANSIRERLDAEPFQPFIIRSSGGRDHLVARSGLVMLLKAEVFVAAPTEDRWTLIPYLHVASLESAPPEDGSNGDADV